MTRPVTYSSPARRVLALTCVALGAALILGAAAEPDNDFHFSLIGDRTGGNHPGVYPRVWREIDLLKPDFAVNVGDTIEGYIRDPGNMVTIANQQWDQIRAELAPYENVPHLFCTGNHDIWTNAAEAIYIERTGYQPNYIHKYQKALFVILDTSRGDDFSEAQYAWLEEQLQNNAACEPTFIVTHKPFWIGPVEAGDKTFRLHQLCKQYGVDWVVTGHGHRLTYRTFDGVEYLEVGSSGGDIGKFADGRPRVDFATGRFFHHIWVRVKGSQVRMTVKEVGGSIGQGRVFDLDNWEGTSPLFGVDADPYEGERAQRQLNFASPTNAQVVPRGKVPVVVVNPTRAGRKIDLTIAGRAIAPDPSGFVVVSAEFHELNSKDLINNLYLNEGEPLRLSPASNVFGWGRLTYALPREQWTAAAPPRVRLTAGTATDGSGANPEDNNDDYVFRNLFVFDGETCWTDPGAVSAGKPTERWLGDNRPGADTQLILALTERLPLPPLGLLVHTWDTTNLPAGDYELAARTNRTTATITVRVE